MGILRLGIDIQTFGFDDAGQTLGICRFVQDNILFKNDFFVLNIVLCFVTADFVQQAAVAVKRKMRFVQMHVCAIRILDGIDRAQVFFQTAFLVKTFAVDAFHRILRLIRIEDDFFDLYFADAAEPRRQCAE